MLNTKIISFRNVLVLIFFYILLFLTYGYYSYTKEKEAVLTHIHKELLHGARSVPLLLDKDYHEQNFDLKKPTSTEDFANIKKLSQFVQNTNLEYIYSFILDKNGKMRFSSSSALDADIDANKSDIYSFDIYKDKNLFRTFKDNKVGVPKFFASKDKWGEFQSVYILLKSNNGRPYVVGADYTQKKITSLQDSILSKIIFLILPIFTIVIIYLLANYTVIKYLKQVINTKTNDLRRAYEIDAFTQLPNQRKLYLDIQKQKSSSYLAILDVDKFSIINNIYGFEYGNSYLRKISQELEQSKDKHLQLYKLNADLFALYAPDFSSLQEFELQIKTLLEHINSIKITLEGYESSLSMKAGIAQVANNEHPLTQAEIALKFAKIHSKPLVHFEDSMDQNRENKAVLDDIQYALENDKILSYFQPIYSLKDKKVIKYESLMRLEKKSGEVMAPYYFLDLAKKTIFYQKLTMVMVTNVIKMAQKHHTIGFSINFSAIDIENETFTNSLLKMIQDGGVSKQITLEILESEEFEEFSKLLTFVHKARALGIKISLDDFGSGYSNISTTIELDLDYLKIDGSLIKNVCKDPRYEKVLKSIINFASQMNALTIAEYVEDELIANKVAELGIDMLQGYYIGKPAPTLLKEE